MHDAYLQAEPDGGVKKLLEAIGAKVLIKIPIVSRERTVIDKCLEPPASLEGVLQLLQQACCANVRNSGEAHA